MVATPVHIPVLLNEVLDTLVLPPGARILDLTLGLGGHAEALLRRCDGISRYMGVDRDPEARALAQARLAHDPRLSVIGSTYEDLWHQPDFIQWKEQNAPEGFDAILADLGVSSFQLKSPSRGFSFREEGPLDMRMGAEGKTAADVVNTYPEDELVRILFEYGQERYARRIAGAIDRARRREPIQTTAQLSAIVAGSVPRRARSRRFASRSMKNSRSSPPPFPRRRVSSSPAAGSRRSPTTRWRTGSSSDSLSARLHATPARPGWRS